MTPNQERILNLAARFFDRILSKGSSIERGGVPNGEDVILALKYAEDGHVFVVRETVPLSASDAQVLDVCERMARHLAALYSDTMAQFRLFGRVIRPEEGYSRRDSA